MCFYYDDYDWIATINEQYFIRGEREHKCLECGRNIAPEEWRRYIYQQEHEMCQICEDDYSEEFDEEQDPATCAHNYGKRSNAHICRECCLILEAIYDLEEKEGCPEHARQPAFGELQEALHYGDEGEYIRHAVEMFPELATHVLCEV